MITAQTKTFSIVAGVACALALTALGGMLSGIQKKDAAYSGRLEARAMRAAVEKEAQSLGALMTETENERKELGRYVLTEDAVVDFLSRIEHLARAQGAAAETRSLAIEAIPDNDLFEQFTLEVAVSGSFALVTEMLPLLESLPYQAQVRAVVVERAGAIDGSALWRGTYRISVTKYK